MARHFVNASAQYLERLGVPVSSAPLTLAIWVKTPTPLNLGWFVALVNGPANGWFLLAPTAVADGFVRCLHFDGTTSGSCSPTAAIPANTWTHVCAVFTSTTRAGYLNGSNKGTQALAVGTPTLDRVSVATVWTGGVRSTTYFDGDLAEVAIWNAALSDAEVATLAAGAPATRVGVGALAAYYPLLGTSSPEPDLMGGPGLTLVNGPTQSAHPPVVGGGAGRMFQVF